MKKAFKLGIKVFVLAMLFLFVGCGNTTQGGGSGTQKPGPENPGGEDPEVPPTPSVGITLAESKVYIARGGYKTVDITQIGDFTVAFKDMTATSSDETLATATVLPNYSSYSSSDYYVQIKVPADAPAEKEATITVDFAGYKASVKVFTIYGKLTSSNIAQILGEDWKDKEDIVIPMSVNDIEEGAFSGGKIYIQNTNTTIKTISFAEGSLLKTVPEGVFSRCKALLTITIPEGVTTIAEKAFHPSYNYDYMLETVILPESLEKIGPNAFSNCMYLKNISIPKNVKSIGVSAFDDCVAITEIEIPSSVKEISEYCFSGCEKLSNVVINDGVEIIGKNAFSYCDALTNIIIPDSVTSIGEYAFQQSSYNKGLESITLSSNLKEIKNSTFKNCQSLKTIVIPEGVTKIGEKAFYGCHSLETVTFPKNSLVYIGEQAFGTSGNLYEYSLKTLTIPASVTFVGCSLLGNFNDVIEEVIFDAPEDWNGYRYDDSTYNKTYIYTKQKEIIDLTNPAENVKILKGSSIHLAKRSDETFKFEGAIEFGSNITCEKVLKDSNSMETIETGTIVQEGDSLKFTAALEKGEKVENWCINNDRLSYATNSSYSHTITVDDIVEGKINISFKLVE